MCIQCAGLAWIGDYSPFLMYSTYIAYLLIAWVQSTVYSMTEKTKDLMIPGRAEERQRKINETIDQMKEMINNYKFTDPRVTSSRIQAVG